MKVNTGTERGRHAQVEAFVELCLDILQREKAETLRGISKMTKMHPTTIRRLKAGKFSTNIRFGTVQKLANAAGVKLYLGTEG